MSVQIPSWHLLVTLDNAFIKPCFFILIMKTIASITLIKYMVYKVLSTMNVMLYPQKMADVPTFLINHVFYIYFIQ